MNIWIMKKNMVILQLVKKKRENDDYFYAAMGGEAIKEMLSRINIMELKKELEDIVKTSKSKAKKSRCFKKA